MRARRPIPRRSKRKPLGRVPKARLTNRAKRATPTIYYKLCDRLGGLIVKTRDNWTCQVCGSTKSPSWAHGFKRSYRHTFVALEVTWCWCWPCHHRFDRFDPLGKDEWMIQRLGKERFEYWRAVALNKEGKKFFWRDAWEWLLRQGEELGTPREILDAARAEAARYGIA